MTSLALQQPLPDWSIEAIAAPTPPPVVGDFSGKPLVVLIFSIGCPGCLGRAIPFANRLVYELGDKLNVIGIHSIFEGANYSDEELLQIKEDLYIRFPFYRDQNYNTTFKRYGAGGTPHWIVTDKAGNVVYSIFGSDPNNALLKLDLKIAELLET